MAKPRDDIDDRLLDLLVADSRTPLKQLGAAVGLSTSAVQERIARLERDGAIRGYTIRRADRDTHRATMLVTTAAQQCATIAPLLVQIPEITRCESVAGDIDMVLTLEATSPARLQDIRDEIAAIAGVVSIVTLPHLVTRFSRDI